MNNIDTTWDESAAEELAYLLASSAEKAMEAAALPDPDTLTPVHG